MSEVSPCSEGCFIQVSVPTEVNVCIDGTAAVSANVFGAIGNISYSWNTLPVQTTQIAVGLEPGAYYTVTVTDDSLCTAVDSVLVNEIECVGPIVCATPFGDLQAEGVGPFTWFEYSETEDCSGCVPFPGLPPCSFPPGCAVIVNEWTQFATGEEVTPPGTFPILVVDGSGDSLVINSLSELPLCTQDCYLQVEIPEVSYLCYGDANGPVTAVVSGALGTVSYAWSTVPAQNAATANLPEGEFTIIATDQYNCSDTATVEVLTLPEILLEFSSTEQVCVGTSSGVASVLATQGVGSYQYSWNTTPPQSMAAISGLGAGTYEVVVTDQANCETTGSVTIGSFPQPVVDAGEDVTICQGEQVELTATGADSYNWGYPSLTTPSIVVSPAYTAPLYVIGTDINGCTDWDEVIVTVTEVPTLIIAAVDSVLCDVYGPIQLNATPAGGVFSGEGVTTSGEFDPAVSGNGFFNIMYSIEVTETCVAHASVAVVVDAHLCDVHVPNIFNPNSDYAGIQDFCGYAPQNNVFALPCLEWYPGNHVRIFDRWGRKVYDEVDYHLKPWDGGKHSDGVYYYVLEISDQDAFTGFFHVMH
jgi:hypothetical protein